MASRSLGTLTLDLIARIGGWEQGLDRAARVAKTRTGEMERTFTRLGGIIRGFAATFTTGFVLHKIIDETTKAQQEIAQLNAVIKSTGNSAGFTVPQLEALAKQIQRTSTFSDEAALAAETVLLQFTRLQNGQFQQALQAVADLSARFGRDMSEVALAVGRAMQGATRGLEGLKKIGVPVSPADVKRFKEISDAGERYAFVLAKLTKASEGAALANRNTLGGALTGLKHAFDDLFELRANQTAGLVGAINALADNLVLLAKIATRVAVGLAIYKTALLAIKYGPIIADSIKLFTAVASGNAVYVDAAVLLQRDIILKETDALVTLEMADAELAAAAAVLARNRATKLRLESELAGSAAINVATRNLTGSQRAYDEALLAQRLAADRARGSSERLGAAYGTLRNQTGRTAGAVALLTGRFGALGAAARAHPILTIIAAIAAAAVAVVSFADDIKVTEDKLVSLRDVGQATFEIIGAAAVKAAKEFGEFLVKIPGVSIIPKTFELLAAGFDLLIEKGEQFFAVLGEIIKSIPGMAQLGVIFDSIGKSWDEFTSKVMTRAREIAEARAKAAAAEGGGVTPPPEDPAAVSSKTDQAIKKIRDMVTALEQQIATMDAGAAAIMRYRIETGDLADDFKTAGKGADQYKESLIFLAGALEKANAAKTIRDFADDLEQQVALYNKGEIAAFDYALAHGKLKEAFDKLGPAADDVRRAISDMNKELQAKKIADKLRDINIQILEMQGNTKEAVTLKFDADFEELIRDLEALGGETEKAGKAAIANLRDRTIAVATFNDAQTETEQILDDLARQEERIKNSRESGAITELESMNETDAARQHTIELLQKQIELFESIPEAMRTPDIIKGIQRTNDALEQLQAQSGLLAKQIGGELKDSFQDALGDVLKGTKSLGDAFKDMIDRIKNYFLDLIAQNFAEKLFGQGGPLGGLGEIFAGFFDTGGFIGPGQFGVVGERGPEIVAASGGGVSVTGRVQTGSFQPRAGLGQTVVQHFMIQAPQGTVSRATQQQIGLAAARGASQAARRNG